MAREIAEIIFNGNNLGVICRMGTVRIHFCAQVAQITDARDLEIEIEDNKTVRDLIKELAKKYGKSLREGIIDPRSGGVREHIVIWLNGKNVLVLEGLNTKLRHNDKVMIMPMATGG